MIGRVAGGVAHELGAPLNVIQGRAKILERSGLPEDQQRHLHDIDLQVRRMTTIIQQLLDCFRHVPDSRRSLDLATVLADVMQRVAEDERCAGRSVTTEGIEVSMPTRAEPLRIGLACLNVIRNACQSAKSCLRVSAHQAGDFWEVRVEDDGPGIPEAQRERIFDRGARLDTGKPGTGLGLAIVRDVAEIYAGTVELSESEDLGGLMVTLRLPRPGI